MKVTLIFNLGLSGRIKERSEKATVLLLGIAGISPKNEGRR
jgi:hypothetical protein